MKKIFLVLMLLILLALPVSANEKDYDNSVGILTDKYKLDFEAIKEYPFETLFDVIKKSFIKAISSPLAVFYKAAALLFISSLINLFSDVKNNLNIVNVLTVLLMLNILFKEFTLLSDEISNGLFALKNFMTAFLPVFAGISFASGEMITSGIYTGFFLVSLVSVANICITYLIPSLNLYLATGITSSISNVINLKPICEFYSKVIRYIMVATVSVICFLLSLQTSLTQSQDSFAVKTGKLFVGSAVPIIGSALQGAVSSVYAGMGILKGFCGVAGIAVILNIFLPSIIKLAINWLGYSAVIIISEMLENKTATDLLNIFKSVVEILISMSFLFMVLLIFSLSIMISFAGVT